MNVGGDPFVIEYNVRMGDPEQKSWSPGSKMIWLNFFMATGKGKLSDVDLKLIPAQQRQWWWWAEDIREIIKREKLPE